MAEGFRAAQAYVEVTARLDEDRLLASARRAAEGVERTLQEGGERAGQGLAGVLGRAGDNAGAALVAGTEGRLRDARGRFVGAGTTLGQDVGKGASQETDRNGFRVFLGLIKSAPKAGLDAASGLVGALKQGISGPAGPYLIAGLSAGAVVAGPFIGALVAGGIISGIAAAGVGAGVILAAKDPEVKHAWSQTGDAIGDILTDSASPFKAELIDAAARGTAAFQRWEPMLHQIFGVASTMLDPFLDALEGAGDRLLPTIMTTINNAGPAVDALAGGIEGTVDAVADVIDMLGDNGPEAAAALKVAFFLVQGSIRNVGMVVNVLTEAFGGLIDMAFGMGDLFIKIGASAQTIPGPIGAMGDKLVGLGTLLGEGEVKWNGMKGAIKGATDVGADGTSKLSERTQFLALSMGAAIEEAGSLSAAFQLLNGDALSAREAERQYQDAIDNVSASIKENGKTLDDNTAKGRANNQAIDNLVTSTDRKAQAVYDETLATKGAGAAQAAASAVYEQGRAQLVKNLTQILGNKTAAEKMAASIMKIPTSWDTDVDVNTKAAESKVRTIKKNISTVKGKTVYITVVERTQSNGDVHVSGSGGSGTQVAGAATGGEVIGGSGYKDDVPLMTMGGEWVIQKRAVRALESQFGPDFMRSLNTWHQGGQGAGTPQVKPGLPGSLVERHARPVRPTYTTGPDGLIRGNPRPRVPGPVMESHVTYIGNVTLDASGMKSIQDVVDLISGLTTTARASRARTVTAAGR